MSTFHVKRTTCFFCSLFHDALINSDCIPSITVVLSFQLHPSQLPKFLILQLWFAYLDMFVFMKNIFSISILSEMFCYCHLILIHWVAGVDWSAVMRVWDGQLKNCDTIAGRSKRFFCSSQHTGLFWGPLSSLVNGYWGHLPQYTVVWMCRWTYHCLMLRLRMNSVVPPLPPYAFMTCTMKTTFHIEPLVAWSQFGKAWYWPQTCYFCYCKW